MPAVVQAEDEIAKAGRQPIADSEAGGRASTRAGTIVSDVPARLECLPWGNFHTLVVIALGITWILDGLEVTLAGALSGALRNSPALRLSNTEVGFAGSAYICGAVLGALFFGWLTDRFGRKKLFFITLSVYVAATAATALSWNLTSFALCRFLTGAGIGGEYSAINSTIQELIPSHYRGWTDLVINGSFWLGAALGAVGSLILLNPAVLDPELGWRLAFLIGACLGLVIFVMRLWIPESPRWLITHGFAERAQATLAAIEATFSRSQRRAVPFNFESVKLRVRRYTPLAAAAGVLLRTYPRRTLVCLALMAAQAFFYNAIFFTYALVLMEFYSIPADRVGWYILPFAAGNFLGPLLLGRLFDTIGRRQMISLTYACAGALLAATGYLFSHDLLSAQTQTLAWMLVFFFASAAASSAYLTASELFPLEIRAIAIALFYAIGTGIGGVAGPWLYGALIETGSRTSVFFGYLLGSALMLGAAAIEWRFGIAAERKPLEAVARPLSFVD